MPGVDALCAHDPGAAGASRLKPVPPCLSTQCIGGHQGARHCTHWGTLLRLSARRKCRDDALAVAMLQVLQRLAGSRDSGLPSGFAGHLTEHILLPCLVWRSGRGAAVIRALCMQVGLP